MRFRTEFQPDRAPFVLNPQKPVVLVGSCFSANIASRMKRHLWKAVTPLGTLYNPVSIFQALDMLLDEERGTERFENSLFQYSGLWHSYEFDSSFSSVKREDCISEFLMRKKELSEALSEGAPLIVTFGTSIVYYLTDNGNPVGNCHKLSAKKFFTQRISETEILTFADSLTGKLRQRFPELKIIYTVSPVRHIKDGFIRNSRSKAVLLLAVEEIVEKDENCHYFPAFEILNDDLRDYRFYATDLVHPSEEAVDYIWDIFTRTYLDCEGMAIIKEGEKIYKANNHRPMTGALGKSLQPE